MNNIRIDWIDLTKGIAIFLMVCGHTSSPLSLSYWIWSFHMPLFFRHYKIFCVNGNTGFRNESRIFYFIHLQNEEAYERKESSSA